MLKFAAGPLFKFGRRWARVLPCGVLLGSVLLFMARPDGCQAAEPRSHERTAQGPARANRLIHAASPYLLLHAHNPVDWYPWGPEALEKARREQKPIFLSVGYSTCYWCHVAEKTIYSDPEIAKLMNAWFVNIKVDREERPDLDRVYMLATQLLTGHGGWPNNVFLTPELKPIFAGSYFPPKDDPARGAGFPTILQSIHEAWTNRREQVLQIGERVRLGMERASAAGASTGGGAFDPAKALRQARAAFAKRFDAEHGGESGGGGTKFPMSPFLALLLEEGAPQGLAMARQQLDAMARGGIHDHLAGGFHRYSTEPTWSLPHFEKMLYDNAQLMDLYASAHRITKEPRYRALADETAAYLRREMADPEGGFYSAQDAEVEGREGASYLWTEGQIVKVLGDPDAKAFLRVYELKPLPVPQTGPEAGMAAAGGVLRMRAGATFEQAQALKPQRDKLLAARALRVQPLRDDKLVLAQNGLAILAFARSGAAEEVAFAERSAERLWKIAFDPKVGTLKHQVFQGRAEGEGFLDDYALFGRSCLALFEATHRALWKDRATQLAEALLKRFRVEGGRLRTTVAEDLIVAPREFGDDTEPSGLSAAVDLLLGLSRLSGDPRYAAFAQEALAPFKSQVAERPEAWPALLAALHAAPPLPAQGLDSAAHVQVRASWQGNKLVLRLTIAKGYHVNANPASLPSLIPTSLAVEGVAPRRILYPKPVRLRAAFSGGELDVFEGTVRIVALMPEKAVGRPLRGNLTVQACTDRVCLAPSKVAFEVRVP